MSKLNLRPRLQVAVVDMQPIMPAVGGGRLRLLGLYHDMGEELEVTYVGSYDWPGCSLRDHRITPTLREIDVPLSSEHFRAAEKLRDEVGGKTVIDSAFADQAHLSPAYVDAARDQVSRADIVFFSHPWAYPLVRDALDPRRQLVIYDAHNVEGLLRASLLDDGGAGTQVVRSVVQQEYRLCCEADLVLACSGEDRQLFASLYGTDIARIRVVPNGVFTRRVVPATDDDRASARSKLGLTRRFAALFLGSAYDPNVEAARFIVSSLARDFPDVEFVIAGGASDALTTAETSGVSNVRVTGFVSDEAKTLWLAAADLALNPMFSGSGTNVKMFEFMAAGLPVVTTAIGARGIETGGADLFEVGTRNTLGAGLRRLIDSAARRTALSARGRSVAERFYSWERISRDLGRLALRHAQGKLVRRRPFYSVIVASYDRHASLTRLVEGLAKQEFTDFELIVVDQSPQPWPDRAREFGLDLIYIHTDVRGAVSSRNTGAFYARGSVLAFTDDDCEPSPEWLAKARPLFEQDDVVGVEGLVKSAMYNDPKWRAVTNRGMAGGFMTANLFLRLSVFNRINGFDLAFDDPHFREDTDLAWRALEFGEMPFSEEAWVFHPPHRRDIARESLAERNRYFVKDALLYRKHPARYRQLLLREAHYRSNPHFRLFFEEGAKEYGVPIEEEILEIIGAKTRNTPAFNDTNG